MEFERVTDGLAFPPEGPVLLADGSVLVVEIRGGRLTRDRRRRWRGSGGVGR